MRKSSIASITYIIKLKGDVSIDVNFYGLNAHVYTYHGAPVLKPLLPDEPPISIDQIGQMLCIEIRCVLNYSDSTSEISRYTRPTFLAILSMLTFFFDYALIPADAITRYSDREADNLDRDFNKIDTINFIIDNKDLKADFTKVLNNIHTNINQKEYFQISLLDRWRKARYLEQQSDGESTYADEAVLSYFHILEMLSTIEYQDKMISEINIHIDKFIEDTYKDILMYSDDRISSDKYKKSIMNFVLPNNTITVNSKIKYMLREYNILDDKVENFIKNIVDSRNSVAHAKKKYQYKMLNYDQFILLTDFGYDFLSTLRVFVAKVITLYLGIDIRGDEWNDTYNGLIVPIGKVKKFISKEIFKNINNNDFFEGIYDNVMPGDIISYFFDGKVSINQFEQVFHNLILNIEEKDLDSIAIVVIILTEAKDSILAEKCRSIVDSMYYDRYTIRDIILLLEHYEISTDWVRNFLETEEE